MPNNFLKGNHEVLFFLPIVAQTFHYVAQTKASVSYTQCKCAAEFYLSASRKQVVAKQLEGHICA